LQERRSTVFGAARAGDAAKVKAGIYEYNVDAAGGEVRKGSESFITHPPKDPLETLMHICAKRGDIDLLEWLDTHSAEPDERNSDGYTAFHVALREGHVNILKYFFDNHSPSDSDYHRIYDSPPTQSLLDIALTSKDPETIWMILNKHLASKEDMQSAWNYLHSTKGKRAFSGSKVNNVEEIINLLSAFGDFESSSSSPSESGETSPDFVNSVNANGRGSSSPPAQPSPSVHKTGTFSANDHPQRSNGHTNGHTRGRYRKSYQNRQQSPANSATTDNVSQHGSQSAGSPRIPNGQSPTQQHYKGDGPHPGRGRGRGKGRGRGGFRGRGRGAPPAHTQN